MYYCFSNIIFYYYLLCIIVSTPEIAKVILQYEGNPCYANGSRTANAGSFHLGDITGSKIQPIMQSAISGL